ncbi:hypothetical protein PAMA_000047 [Pampus argenteus]
MPVVLVQRLPLSGSKSMKETFLPLILMCTESQPQGAVFLPEFASPQGSFMEDATEDQFLTYRYDDQMDGCDTYFPCMGHWHQNDLDSCPACPVLPWAEKWRHFTGSADSL